MNMILKIYKNNEQVNEITSTDATTIYKEIAKIYFSQNQKIATKTYTNYLNNKLEVVQIFNKTDIYTYNYVFENVSL